MMAYKHTWSSLFLIVNFLSIMKKYQIIKIKISIKIFMFVLYSSVPGTSVASPPLFYLDNFSKHRCVVKPSPEQS